MFSKREMAEYSSMVIEDGNQEMKEFYENHLDDFTRCPVTKFDNYALVLRKLAIILHNSLDYYLEDWKIYALEMGISDNQVIANIKTSAEVFKELPLYLTMTVFLQRMNGKLGNIIRALLKIQRYDALEYLRPYVQELLAKMNTSEGREMVCIPCLEIKNEDILLQPFEKLAKDFTLAVKSEFSTTDHKCQVESLNKDICFKNSSFESKSLPSLNSSEQNCKKLLEQEIDCFPSTPLEKKLSVFIQHTEQDSDVAKELSIRMKKLGIAVKTYDEVEMLIMMDSAGALGAILQEVDFIVPVVSRNLFQQIHPHMKTKQMEKQIESSDALINRTLYQLIYTQYQSNNSINFKVRAVLLPDMNRGLLTTDAILFYGFRLWEEFPKLVRILRETKNLIAKYPFY